ncbi:hypothetical protein [Bacillus sp. JCM 19034]|uniref:hypothetical protein n=1 Tax=Bacillus sp. JCM 19034 TaxID=1481928 RepID=UPI0007866995|nr:hypothetical protein [Bacillus sp. JCM 19034]
MTHFTAQGRSVGITVDPDVITAIFKDLLDIIAELESEALPAIKELGRLRFYQSGQAMEAMEVYPEANEKFHDLFDNYLRASTLVMDVLVTMAETDQAIAEQILTALGD